jgi:hypothetical protein
MQMQAAFDRRVFHGRRWYVRMLAGGLGGAAALFDLSSQRLQTTAFGNQGPRVFDAQKFRSFSHLCNFSPRTSS